MIYAFGVLTASPERPDEKSPPVGGLFCMVDVKELESLTTRTSSECSTS